MKKIIIASLFVLSPLFASADVVEETPTPTPEPTPVVEPSPTPTPEVTPVVEVPVTTTTTSQSTSSSGGFRNACFYIQAYDKKPCVDSKELQQKFRLDQAFHNYVIGHWFATWRVTFN